MTVAPLVVIAALLASPAEGPEASALVAKLGSADAAERASAAGSIQALGREALPALERAVRGDDAELGLRASALWDAIQLATMARPSLVRLGPHGRSPAAVIEDLGRQTGLTLKPNQADGSSPAEHAPAPGPLPFWEAVDRLGFKGAYLHDPGGGKFRKFSSSPKPTGPTRRPTGRSASP